MSECNPNLTPMMRQYLEVKKKHQDAVLFFRMGDFYEMFNNDAVEVSRMLNITLTQRAGYKMCGIPYHAAGNYIKRLLNSGQKIAVCEQISEPGQGKIVEREVVRVITPGTVIEEAYLEQNSNNFIASAGVYANSLSFSYVDISTGEFYTSAFPASQLYEVLKREVFRINCIEILIQESLLVENPEISRYLEGQSQLIVNRYPDWAFDLGSSLAQLKAHFKTASLKGFGIEDGFPGLYSCGILLEYLGENSRVSLKHINQIKKYSSDEFVTMDEATLKNLEILKNLQDGSHAFTLFKVLNHTKTSSGARLLKNWLINPLKQVDRIVYRQERVKFLYHEQMLLSSIRDILGKILDFERLTARLSMDKAHGKDLLALGQSILSFLQLKDLIVTYDTKNLYFNQADSFYDNLQKAADLILNSLVDDPSILLTEGRLIRKGYSEELDHLRSLKDNSQQVLTDYLNSEREKTGIPTLKVKYNKIIGYFLEITKSNLGQVPDYFIRRQSLVGNERFTTEKLNEIEVELNGATERSVYLEKELFLEIREGLKSYTTVFSIASHLVSELDCFQSFAWVATVNNYHCPEMDRGSRIIIEQGRHPVVEKSLNGDAFVPNSIQLDNQKNSFILITGPNMAGKSTLLRQVALITLMAQTGSFVPASYAKIGVVDRIFCRVGASDNLARGESTFLVEMNETANILRNASATSLVIMDEVGRGTSTDDGLSIAWAVSEALIDRRSRTLFATHYHELTLLEHPALSNKSLKVIHEKDQIIFMKELIDGPATSSYGIYVAKLAGLPASVIERARQVMKHLESQTQLEMDSLPNAHSPILELFSPTDQFLQKILSYDLYRKNPLEVMQDLAIWQKEIKDFI